MTQALQTVLPLAVAIAVFPVPIIAAVLLAGSDRGRSKCLAFFLAWCIGLVVACTIALLLADLANASREGEQATWVTVTLSGLGVACLVAAVQKWRGRPGPGEETPTPAWMSSIETFTVTKAGLTGFALAGLNPKNVALAAAAGVEIAAFGLDAGQEVATMLLFVGVASLGVLAPLVLSLVTGTRSRDVLDGMKGWLTRWNAVIVTSILALIGLKLLADAVVGFT